MCRTVEKQKKKIVGYYTTFLATKTECNLHIRRTGGVDSPRWSLP